MSDRGPADEEPGDAAETQLGYHPQSETWPASSASRRWDSEHNSAYRFRGARSRQCCRPEWSFRSGPRAGSGARCEDQTTTCCSGFPTPPSRCRNSCAEKRPAGPGRGWWWRRSHADGGAGDREATNEHLWYQASFSSPLTFPWRDSALWVLSRTISNSYISGLHHLRLAKRGSSDLVKFTP